MIPAALLIGAVLTQPLAAHWSFVAPTRPALATLQNVAGTRNPIDLFIRQRLEREGLTPSSEASKETLIRRLTLDLTGLPPTCREIDQFLNDRSPNACEKLVDRLLASPRYGERMAIRWLEAARYADTCGYQNDGERIMWRWRDWVIDAYNANMPFDRFTIEQIAGDMLPNATLDQSIATGFNRNHRGNGEGGIIPEEYAVEYVVDRVDTTATVWLGLTMGCARCHDHKYDPIRQKEFYQVFAYFNNVPEHGRAVKYGNSPPFLKTPTRDQRQKFQQLDTRIRSAHADVNSLNERLNDALREWERALPNERVEWEPGRKLIAKIDGADLDGKKFVDAGNVGEFGYDDKFTLAARIRPADVKNGAIISRMPESPEAEGYCVRLVNGHVRVELTKRWLDDALRVETVRTLPAGDSHHIAVTCDGSRLAKGVTIYVDGMPEKQIVLLDELNQTFVSKEPLRIGSGGGPDSRFRGTIARARVYGTDLTADEIAWLADDRPIRSASAGKRLAFFLDTAAPSDVRSAHRRLFELQQDRRKLLESFPTTMVMEEMPTPRQTYVLTRGEYDKRGERVQPGLPRSLPQLPPGVSNNRLGFAKWLVDPSNPLTARVTVNRLWQMVFGVGLVKTAEDFGIQGQRPSHPELLDWLAVEFMHSGWDVKAMLRLIVTSATYRQSSRVTPAQLAKDSENRLLSRGPRLRLSSEMLRDQALAVSGLLVERLGGPSVRPYQPAGLGKDLGADVLAADKGEGLYRRSLYTFWKRTVAPPNMLAFDATGRELCNVREVRTNTPLQALTLLNDVTFVEASRKLAERVMKEGGNEPRERLVWMFRAVNARKPTEAELGILLGGFEDQLRNYKANADKARKLLASGDSALDAKLDATEMAAYSAIAGLILNLDEAITKE
jgi:Protein of unknown function (DUF1553)/Protein of unknown function (DUF1549)/Concanavalin A-like lectin/glucanases superfamily